MAVHFLLPGLVVGGRPTAKRPDERQRHRRCCAGLPRDKANLRDIPTEELTQPKASQGPFSPVS
jgi:hypothetical protein